MTRYFKGPVQLPYLKKQWKRVSGPVSATDHFTVHSTWYAPLQYQKASRKFLSRYINIIM